MRCILLRDVAVSHRRSLDVRASSLFYQKSIYLSIYGPEWAAGWAGIGKGIGPAALPGVPLAMDTNLFPLPNPYVPA